LSIWSWPYFIIFILIGSIFLSLYIIESCPAEESNVTSCNVNNIKDISIAIYTDDKEDEEFYAYYGRTRYFMWALSDYSWTVGNTTYRFVPKLFSTEDLLKGVLNINNFDVLLYPASKAEEDITFSNGRN